MMFNMFVMQLKNGPSAASRLHVRLMTLAGVSIYGALLLVAFGSLVIPAIVGSYLLVGVQEQKSARAALDLALQRNADILALGMQESLWNLNAESARLLGKSPMRDPAVLHIRVSGHADVDFLNLRSARLAGGALYRAERDIVVAGERIGRALVAMDDDDAIAIAIIELGKSLNMSVIAEGVETADQAQGYFYSRPELAQAVLERWLGAGEGAEPCGTWHTR